MKVRKLQYFLIFNRENINKVRIILNYPLQTFLILMDSIKELIKLIRYVSFSVKC